MVQTRNNGEARTGETIRKRVLVVDDEPGIRKLYERELVKEGYEVLFATSGMEALLVIQNSPVDLVVLDIRMPGLDGIQTLARMLERNNELPVVLNTAFTSYRDNFLTWPADAYVVKSSDLTELKNTIRSLLENSSSTEATVDC